MEKKLGVTLKKYTNSEFKNSLENCLLIIDNSCKEVYSDKEFVKLATAMCHKKINVIYIKQNLYQQNKGSGTENLNTTHFSLFKSARIFEPVEYLGKQLNLVKLLKRCYQMCIPHKRI